MNYFPTSWEKIKDRRTYYASVTLREVVVGDHFGSGHTDNAGSCSHADFIKGTYQSHVKTYLGENVLKEVLYAIENLHNHPDFVRQVLKLEGKMGWLKRIPMDPNLAILADNPSRERGFVHYGNSGGYKTVLKSDSVQITFERNQGFVSHIFEDMPGQSSHFKLNGHGSSVVALKDQFYLICSGNFVAIGQDGSILFDTWEEDFQKAIFGSELRLTEVYKCENSIFVKYSWFGNSGYPEGFLEFELGKGFVGRSEIKAS